MSDSVSPDAQPKISVIPNTMSHQSECDKVTSELPERPDVQPSTSKDTPKTLPAQPNETLMVPATSEETKTVIDALLLLGSDLQLGLNMEQSDNQILQPIAPGNVLPDPTPMVAKINSDDTDILGEQANLEEEDTNVESTKSDADNRTELKKGQLVVQSFQLPWNQKPRCKFGCVGCSQKFDNNKELNDHFRTVHPPLTCSDCKRLFPTPSAFKKHKYKHYEFMYECDKCSKGFHFESELAAHKRKHIADQGLACFHANSGKRFKCSSELNAHLKNHMGKPIKCDYCTYTNKDIRYVPAHAQGPH